MKSLWLKRLGDNITEPVCLVFEDGKRLKFGEHDLFGNFSEGERFEVYFFGDYRMPKRKQGVVKKIEKIDDIPYIITDWDEI